MLCDCHGEPRVWKTDRRKRNGGYWRCREAIRADNRGRDRHRRYWHAANGGYIRRRRKHLAQQRTQILDQLQQLEQEATSCR